MDGYNYTTLQLALGQTYTYKHVATPGLLDVRITIFNSSSTALIITQPMTELASLGVYLYAYTPTTADTFTGVMNSLSDGSKSVVDLIIAAPSTTTSPTVISNSVGVGTQC